MSRSDKLYRRLRELEAEYRQLVGRELRRYLDAGHSRVLWRMLHPTTFRNYFSPDEEHIDWLSKEIDMLRNKLGESIQSNPASDIRKLTAIVNVKYNPSAIPPLLKEIIERWGKVKIPNS